jgi:regulator of sigma E protease
MLVGFDFGVSVHNYNVFSGAVMTVRELGATTSSLLTGLVHAFTSSKVRHEVSSIVGITQVTQVAVSNGWGFAFIVFGFVSLALAVINLFPFLPLDGGHIAWTGLVLLAFLVINGLLNDISRIAS